MCVCVCVCVCVRACTRAYGLSGCVRAYIFVSECVRGRVRMHVCLCVLFINFYFDARVNCLIALGDKAPASGAADPGFESRFLSGDFSGSSHTSDLKTGTPVAILKGEWRNRINAGTGWSGVSIL